MIAILDYEAGNLTSVELAVRHVGGEPVVTQDPAVVRKAGRILFPGVGSARACMDNLIRLGLDRALRDALDAGTPVFAICIGQQLLFGDSEEDNGTPCLGILPGQVRRFRFPPERHVKIPHMGWNDVTPTREHPLFAGIPAGSAFYFVHAYHVCPGDDTLACATTDYAGTSFASAVARGTLFATQFHPEKSGEAGLQMLRNFLTWDGQDAATPVPQRKETP